MCVCAHACTYVCTYVVDACNVCMYLMHWCMYACPCVCMRVTTCDVLRRDAGCVCVLCNVGM